MEARNFLASDVVISEFLADNNGSLIDEDGSFSDWIELTNTTSAAVNLSGWSLTDNAANLDKWQFPSMSIPGHGRLVVFASGKARSTLGSPLHTSFQLDADGEYLALVRPDETIASQYAPAYPQQYPNVSYGMAAPVTTTNLVNAGSAARWQVAATRSALPAGWSETTFNDSSWNAGTASLGYDTGAVDATYPQIVAASQPIHYWRFEETSASTPAADQGVPGGSAGTYRNIDVNQSSASPAMGRAISVDGDFDDITHVIVPAFHPGNAITVEAWVNPTLFTQKLVHGIFGRYTDNFALGVDGANEKLIFTVRNDQNLSAVAESVYPIATGQWHHVVGIFANGIVTLYVNGVRGTTTHLGGVLRATTANIIPIGSVTMDSDPDTLLSVRPSTWQGLIDEVAVYNRRLEAEEVQNHYRAGLTATNPNFTSHRQTDIRTAMQSVGSVALQRASFDLASPQLLQQLTLRIKYDDGFVAYLNGQEVARHNAPGAVGQPLASTTTAVRARTDALAVEQEIIDLSSALPLLHSGRNVLAIAGLNVSSSDADFLLAPELWGVTADHSSLPLTRYFVLPTPGLINAVDHDRGPVISAVAREPTVFADDRDAIITAKVEQYGAAVSTVTMRYRVMYGSEIAVIMTDNGQGADAVAGDKIYTAVIPRNAALPGQMVRYYVTAATSGNQVSRWPLYNDPSRSPEYLGGVVAHATPVSALPTVQWFVQNQTLADSSIGTRASIYFQNEFYDNVFVRVRGASLASASKKPYKFDFNSGHHFRYDPNLPRVEEINLNSSTQDSSYVRPVLAFDTYRLAGVPAPDAMNVRAERNGMFHSLAVLIEQLDADFLVRQGLDGDGALYKVVEKKTRRHESNDDLAALLTGLSANRTSFLLDNVDLSELVNYLAAGTIIQDADRQHHNYYLYRDTLGTGLWQMLPWDKDLTFGRVAIGGDFVSGSDGCFSDPLLGMSGRCGTTNILTNVVYADPNLRQLYLRRLRSLMDKFLQAPGTRLEQLHYDNWLNANYERLRPDAALDFTRWGGRQNLLTAFNAIKTDYLADRRNYLYNFHSIASVPTNPESVGIPNAQPDIASLPAAQRRIGFGALDYAPVSGNQDQEYFTLVNTNPFAVDVSGWKITGGVQFDLPAGTVIPAQGTLHVAADVREFRSRTVGPRAGQGLLIVGGYEGHLSSFGESLRLGDAENDEIATLTYVGDPSGPQRFLRISEVMYHPAAPPIGDPTDNDEFEFVELVNTGAETLNLNGVHFTKGVEFTFANTTLGAGEHVLIVKNHAAFESRYGAGLNVAGEFIATSLSNGDDRVKLEDAANNTIADFTYSDDWYPVTDGGGYSLVAHDAGAAVDLSLASSWRRSSTVNGSPGITDPPLAAAITGRWIFYNNSGFDNPQLGGSDDLAIGPDKSALLPGQTATFANYTSYYAGINGLMIDIQNLAGELTADDFEFRVGNDNNPAAWSALATMPAISVRSGAGVNGSDRVTLIWPDAAVKKAWLQVTVKPTQNTGLTQPDVFYFGNAVGESGDSPTDARVTSVDEIVARNNPRTVVNPAEITSRYDYDRDARVSAVDQIIARNNRTQILDRLNLIQVPSLIAPAGLRAEGLIAMDSAEEQLQFRRLAWSLVYRATNLDSAPAVEQLVAADELFITPGQAGIVDRAENQPSHPRLIPAAYVDAAFAMSRLPRQEGETVDDQVLELLRGQEH